jgi:ABC-type uncharacterized transport system involved in gliding motility auxiliary subunit
MKMNKKNLETTLYSAGGVIVLAIILIAVNFLLGTFNQRVDLTQGHLYTLSQGTKNILSKLQAPVTIRFYYSQNSTAIPVELKTFATRVEDVLNEYERAGHGKVIIQKLDPEPDSDAEDSATLDGIQPQLTNTQDQFYLGLSVSFLDKKAALPVLSPDREQLLEYDITRAITRVASTSKPVIGLMSALPILGQSLNLQTRQQPSEPWVLANELKGEFTVKKVDMDAVKIPDDIKVLLVVQPRDISEESEYALDQFVMRGGKLIAFLDPYAYSDQQPDPRNPLGGTTAGSSTFNFLLKSWGYDMPDKVVADMTYASGQGDNLVPTLLSLDQNALNKSDVATSQLGSLLIPFAGAFIGHPAPGLTQTVLAQTSPNTMLVDKIIATLSGETSTRGFKPTGKPYLLAIRLNGKFKTAFPKGDPNVAAAAAAAAEAAADAAAAKKAASPNAPAPAPAAPAAKPADVAAPPEPAEIMQSPENAVVLVSDADMLTDGASVDTEDVYGQKVVVPRNGNLNFAQGLVEQVAGDFDLSTLRSRASFVRPLTVIQNMDARAQQKYLGKINDLQESLNQTQEKLVAMQKQRPGGQSTVLSPAQQTEVDNFKLKAVQARRDLKDLRKNLRAESESLQLWTKVLNIGVVPLLVALLGILLAITRRRRAMK